MNTITIYTDGACSGNPGPGGYGTVLKQGQHRKELSGGFKLTTNNRMEMLACIIGLESLKNEKSNVKWARMLDLLEKHNVEFIWVKGHAGNPENERCDELAVNASQDFDLSDDVEFLKQKKNLK